MVDLNLNPLLLSSLLIQLKEYTSLLETQLENHLETASSERQNYTKEVEVVSVAAVTFLNAFLLSLTYHPIRVLGIWGAPRGSVALQSRRKHTEVFAPVWVVDTESQEMGQGDVYGDAAHCSSVACGISVTQVGWSCLTVVSLSRHQQAG